MATITPSTDSQADLKLVDKSPEITHSGSGDRFTVKFTMEGVHLRELQNALGPRLAAVGVERISRFGMTISLHGVEAGRESEVFHELETAIEDVNRLRQSAHDEQERSRSVAAAAEALAERRLEEVRDGFQAARGSPTDIRDEELGGRRASGIEEDGGTTRRRQP